MIKNAHFSRNDQETLKFKPVFSFFFHQISIRIDQMNSIFHLATIVSRKSLQKSFQESSPESLNWKIVDKIPVGSFDVD